MARTSKTRFARDYDKRAHQRARHDRDRRAAEIKAKSAGPPVKLKGPTATANSGEPRKVDLLLGSGEIDNIDTHDIDDRQPSDVAWLACHPEANHSGVVQ